MKTMTLRAWMALSFVACTHGNDARTPTGGRPGDKKGGGDRPISVEAQTVTRQTVPLFLDGIGSAQALYTVTVHARVDGELNEVLFKEGQDVKKGEVLAQIDPRPFAIQKNTAAAQLAKDQAALTDNQLNLDRYKSLRKQNLIQQQTVDDQQALVDQTLAAIKSDEAQIDNAKLQLTYARITSPIDGRTGIRLVDPGNIVHAADAGGIVVITEMDPIALIFTLPEDNLPAVSNAMAAGPLVVEAFSRDGKIRFGDGKVLLVDNQINQQTGTIKLKAMLANPLKTLWPNQFIKARLLVETRQDALVVPQVALQRGPEKTFVYVVKADHTVEPRTVTVEVIEGDQAIIATGIEAGEVVVTDGQYKLKPGALVSIQTTSGGGGTGGATTTPTQDSAR